MLPVCRAARLQALAPSRRWLVEELWADEGVGIVGGEPKCGKSFLALDLAVAVASGAPALRRFPVKTPGPVLLFAAEDPLHVVRSRLEGIAVAAGVHFETLDVHVITQPVLRLDSPHDRTLLRETVKTLAPRLVVLDPFARLHRIDENAAAEVAPLLASLRILQRRFHTAVLLVHHARKGAAHLRAGQALRGSSELHAWGDSNLYLRRDRHQIKLSVEQRAAAPLDDLSLELVDASGGPALRISEANDSLATPPKDEPTRRILEALAQASHPLSREELRARCHLRNQTLGHALATLLERGRIGRSGRRYVAAP